MEKSVKFLKAELVDTLYERTINGMVEWDDIGRTGYSRLHSMSDEMGCVHHSWEFEGESFKFTLKKSVAGMYTKDHLVISIINGVSSIIDKKDIDDVFVVNPIEALIECLEDIKQKNTHYPNITFIDMIKRIKDSRI